LSACSDGVGVQHSRLSLLSPLFDLRRSLAIAVRRLVDARKRGSLVSSGSDHRVNSRGCRRRFAP
jgi:hypothetical protein